MSPLTIRHTVLIKYVGRRNTMQTRKCSHCGQVKDLTEKHWKKRKDNRYKVSKIIFHYECRDCTNKRRSESRLRNIAAWRDHYGRVCTVCGYDKCSAALDFHHTDPDKKTKMPTQLMGSCHPTNSKPEHIARTKAELDTCKVVCANCHREIHADDNGVASW